MIYPYFTATVTQMLMVGGLVVFGLGVALWLGW